MGKLQHLIAYILINTEILSVRQRHLCCRLCLAKDITFKGIIVRIIRLL